jgi:transposase InsO family protein
MGGAGQQFQPGGGQFQPNFSYPVAPSWFAPPGPPRGTGHFYMTAAARIFAASVGPDILRWLWLGDSGASDNFCKERSWFVTFSESNFIRVKTSDEAASGFVTRGFGLVRIAARNRRGQLTVFMLTCHYAPDVAMNVIGYYVARRAGVVMRLEDSPWLEVNGEQLPMQFERPHGTLPLLQTFPAPAVRIVPDHPAVTSWGAAVNVLRSDVSHSQVVEFIRSRMPERLHTESMSLLEYHYRRGHRNQRLLLREVLSGAAPGVTLTDHTEVACAVCKLANFPTPAPSALSTGRGLSPLERVDMDLGGRLRVSGIGGVNYHYFFLDTYSSRGFVLHLRLKSDAPAAAQRLLDALMARLGVRVRVLYSDRGGEFVNAAMRDYCAARGIEQRHSAPYHHNQNARIERFIRTTYCQGRAMLIGAPHLPTTTHPLAIDYALAINNHSGTTTLPSGVVPEAVLFNRVTRANRFQIFGCRAFAKIMKPDDRNKQTADSVPCYFAGVSEDGDSYRCLTPRTFKLFTAAHLRFAPAALVIARTGWNTGPWWGPDNDHLILADAVVTAPALPQGEAAAELPVPSACPQPAVDLERDAGIDAPDTWSSAAAAPTAEPPLAPAAAPAGLSLGGDDGGVVDGGVLEQEQWMEQQQPSASAPPAGEVGAELEQFRREWEGEIQAAAEGTPNVAASPRTGMQPHTGAPPATPRKSQRERVAVDRLNISSNAVHTYRPAAATAVMAQAFRAGEEVERGGGFGSGGAESAVGSIARVPVWGGNAWVWQAVEITPASSPGGAVAMTVAAISTDTPNLLLSAPEHMYFLSDATDNTAVGVSGGSAAPASIMLGAPRPGAGASAVTMIKLSPRGPPRNRREAKLRPDWPLFQVGEGKELQGHFDMKTWRDEVVPMDTPTIGCMWVYDVKADDRRKARLVALGNQVGDDVEQPESSSATVGRTAVLILLALANEMGWPVFALDVTQAYLYGMIPPQYRFYMRPPPGYQTRLVIPPGFKLVLQLLRALYGLEFAGRLWYERIDKALRSQGFAPSRAELCLYVHALRRIYCALFVDDLLLTGQNRVEVMSVHAALALEFKMTELGEVKRFLGMEIVRQGLTLTVTQERYIDAKVAEFAAYLPPASAPCPVMPYVVEHCIDRSMCPADGSDAAREMRVLPYRSLVGVLLYPAICTRPDIFKIVHDLARVTHNPGLAHWRAALHVLRYLSGTRTLGLRFTATGRRDALSLQIVMFVDASFAPDVAVGDGRSCGGYMAMLGGAPVLVSVDRHSCTTTSTMESEYVQLAMCCKENGWLRALMTDFLLPPVGPTRVMEDNNQVVLAVTRPVPTRATRHVVVRYCYVQDLAQAGEIVVIYCSTVAQLADVLTKLVGRVIFLRLRTVVLGYGSWAELCVSVEGGGVLPRTNRATPHAESS